MKKIISIFLVSVISILCFSNYVIAQNQDNQFNPTTIFLLLDDQKAGFSCSNCTAPLSCQDAACGVNSCIIDLKAGFCLILDTCYVDGDANPENECEACDGSSPDSWANKVGSCNDENACTYDDSCSNGICAGTSYSCNDGNPNTQDICLGDGTCSNPSS